MTVKIRDYKGGGLEVDIRFTYPDGTEFRRRLKAPVSGRSAAKRWGEQREGEFLRLPSPKLAEEQHDEGQRKEIPTLREFVPDYIEKHAIANRLKASSVWTYRKVARLYLVPLLGHKRLDKITNVDVQAIKSAKAASGPKTVNQILFLLGHMLTTAKSWNVLATLPCTITPLKVPQRAVPFFSFEEYARVVEAAREQDAATLAAVLLAGDAGLRRGEILALRWCHVDFERRRLTIEESVWEGNLNGKGKATRVLDTTKGYKTRIVPMTEALYGALQAVRHLRGEQVLYNRKGKMLNGVTLHTWVNRAEKRAGLPRPRALHLLRHTFCSHLAMRGAPIKAIQELAGHRDLNTTIRYVHLGQGASEGAIALLNGRGSGEMLETPPASPATTQNRRAS